MDLDLIFQPNFDNCFDVFGAPTFEPGAGHGAVNGHIRIPIQNRSGDHVNVVFECAGMGIKLESGEIPDGQDGLIEYQINFFGGTECKITRWRPGLWGVGGNGGGEIRLIVPGDAKSAEIPLLVKS